MRPFDLLDSSSRQGRRSLVSFLSSTDSTGSHICCSPTTCHTLSRLHLLPPASGQKKARLPTHASLWVTDALCTINHIRMCQIRTNSDISVKQFRGKKTRKASTNHSSILHAQKASIFPHFLTQNHLKNEFSPIFNSKKQVQNRINQDKKRQTKTKEFI